MAPFDHDPKNSNVPPARQPEAAGGFDPVDALFKPPDANARSQPGDFTKLFQKPPKPEHLPEPLPEPFGDTPTGPLSLPPSFAANYSGAVSHDTAAPSPATPATAEPAGGPSPFTRMFGNSARQPSGEAPVEPIAQPTPPATVAQEPVNSPESFTQFFSAPVQPAAQTPPRAPTTPDPVPNPASSKEFARLYNFPLRDSSSADEPTPRSDPGEFTKIFGSSTPPLPASAPAGKDHDGFANPINMPISGASKTAGPPRSHGLDKLLGKPADEPGSASFTGTFGDDPTSINTVARQASYPPPPRDPVRNPEKAPLCEEKQQSKEWPPAILSRTPSDAPSSGATVIFTPPGALSEAPPPAPAPGPSDYTKIISSSQVREAQQQSAMQKGQPPAPSPSIPLPSAALPALPMVPAVPGIPGVTPPAASLGMSNAAPMPTPVVHMQAPSVQIPQMQMPQPPKLQPPSSIEVPAKTSWMPVIIGLNVFFVIVVILILFFALRRS